MPRIDRRSVQNFDWVLLGLTVVLLFMGFVNLVSATNAGAEIARAVDRQLFSLLVGSAVLVVVLFIDYRHFERLAVPIYAASMLLVLATLFVSEITRGSQSWLYSGRFQPAELAKVAMVIALARYFHRNPPGEIRRLRDLGPPAVLVAIPVGLILLQRDLGVALLTLLIASVYLPFVRIPWRAWAAVVAVGAAAAWGGWSSFLRPHQRARILDFLDPSRDPLDSGYQALQSRIAVGSGGFLGKGYLDGTQTQLRFLPTQHTDFVFSVLAEEWGFVGSTLVLGLYLVLLLWGLLVARNSKDGFGAMLAIGIVGTLFWPAVINVAMVLGLAPVIGVPLPFFSYGGSALVIAMLGSALLLNVSMRRYVF